MNRVLFVAAEAVPFIKTGGLADVVGSLPKELIRQGADVRIILPKYSDIPAYWQDKMVFLKAINISMGWRRQYCGIFKLEEEGITYYFIDNEYYFKRSGLYGFNDDAERFAYFCRAVLEAMPYLGFAPAILHCHDWHTAVLPVLLKAHYDKQDNYAHLRTVLTIHNIQYQGVFDKAVLSDLLELNEEDYFTDDSLEFYGKVNYLKAGIAFADAITTVSKTYAREILTENGGRQLAGLLRKREGDLCGIINGIDYHLYNPAKDQSIPVNYTFRSISRKQINKARIQEYLGLEVTPGTALISVVTRLVAAKGVDLIATVLDELMALDVQMVVLGTGEEKYESMFRVAAHSYPHRISANIFFDENLAHKIYAGSDLYLMPSLSEPCGISQLIALRYGSVPIVRETGGLKDTIFPYNEYTGEGNGFSFSHYNAQDMLYTIKRALSFYRDEQWQHIVKAAMKSDFSWRRSALEYFALYYRLA
jgi:starch synthase